MKFLVRCVSAVYQVIITTWTTCHLTTRKQTRGTKNVEGHTINLFCKIFTAGGLCVPRSRLSEVFPAIFSQKRRIRTHRWFRCLFGDCISARFFWSPRFPQFLCPLTMGGWTMTPPRLRVKVVAGFVNPKLTCPLLNRCSCFLAKFTPKSQFGWYLRVFFWTGCGILLKKHKGVGFFRNAMVSKTWGIVSCRVNSPIKNFDPDQNLIYNNGYLKLRKFVNLEFWNFGYPKRSIDMQLVGPHYFFSKNQLSFKSRRQFTPREWEAFYLWRLHSTDYPHFAFNSENSIGRIWRFFWQMTSNVTPSIDACPRRPPRAAGRFRGLWGRGGYRRAGCAQYPVCWCHKIPTLFIP